jgi:hypothetical protein
MNIIEIPSKPADIEIPNRRWALNAYALYFLATELSPVRVEHEQRLAEYFDTSSRKKYITNVFRKDLIRAGLIHVQTISYLRGVHMISLVRLNEKGKELCRSFGWQICENEWERLVRLHSGDGQPRHTAAMIVFSLSARQRGWKVTMLPQTDLPQFRPDLLLEKMEECFYVEVELGSRKKEKWNLYKKLQGHAALCGKTYESTRTLIEECAAIRLSGRATSLDNLVYYRNNLEHPLFSMHWNEEGKLNGNTPKLSSIFDQQG